MRWLASRLHSLTTDPAAKPTWSRLLSALAARCACERNPCRHRHRLVQQLCHVLCGKHDCEQSSAVLSREASKKAFPQTPCSGSSSTVPYLPLPLWLLKSYTASGDARCMPHPFALKNKLLAPLPAQVMQSYRPAQQDAGGVDSGSRYMVSAAPRGVRYNAHVGKDRDVISLEVELFGGIHAL